jgi:hypothetical protein
MLSALFVVTRLSPMALIPAPHATRIMQIVLRKLDGKTAPVFRTSKPRSFGASAPAGTLSRALRGLLSPIVAVVLLVAFIAAWAIGTKSGFGHAFGGASVAQLHASHLGAFAFAGSLATAKDIRAKRANIAEQANALLETAGKEKRELNAEEQVSFETMHGDRAPG